MNRPHIELRRVTPADRETFLALERTRVDLRVYSATGEEDVDEQIRGSVNYFIVVDDEIVGDISYRIHAPDHAEIDGLLLKPEAEGKGYAKAAMLMVLDELKSYPRVHLMTHPHNRRSLPLYLSLGFVIDGLINDYYGDGEPRLLMNLVRTVTAS